MQDERRPTQKTQETANKHPSETEPQSGSDWLSTIRERLSGLEAIIAFITTLIAFAVALQENFYLSILILVIGGLVVLLVLLMHLAFGGMPRLGGGKGEQGQQNAIVRPWALVGLLMVLGLAVSPLFWRPSRSFVASAMRGTPTPTPSATPTPTRTSTPTVTPTAIPTATPTPRPEVLRMTLESVDLQMEVACTKPVLIPADVEPSEVEYRQMADWVTYGMFQDRSFAELTLTNLSDTEWIKVSNQVMARVISHTELPGPIDFARLVGCGGIGAAREFPPIEIDAERLTSASVPDVDFFTLQKGEFEVFRVELNATEPGLYEVALGVEYSYEGTTREAWTQQPVKVYAPESYYIWTNAGGGLQMQDLYDR